MATVLAKFSLPFQRRVLQLVIQDVTFASQYASFLRTNYFESPRYARLFEAWQRLYRRLGLPPTGTVLLESCRLTNPDLQPVVRKVAFAEPLPVAEVRFITQELSRYVRFQALKTALRDSVEPLGRGDLDTLERGLQTALQMGRRSMDGGERWYVKHVAERLSFSAQESFMAMLIPPLDAVVKVGRQDLVVGLAAPNTGKTFFLLWMMLAAYVQKKKAVFYTLEMPAITLARRLDSVVAKRNTADRPRARGLVLARVQKLGKVYGDNLVFKIFPMQGTDVFDIRQHVQSLVARGFTPDIICIDDADLLRASVDEGSRRSDNGRYFEIGHIDGALNTFNQAFNGTTFTVSQARRTSSARCCAAVTCVAMRPWKPALSILPNHERNDGY